MFSIIAQLHIIHRLACRVQFGWCCLFFFHFLHVAPAQSVAAVRWADSVTKTLSTHEALAQLLLVVPPANGIAQDVANYSPGGVYAAAGSLLLQQQAPLPLWQAMPFGQLLATESAFLCANEQLLFSALLVCFLCLLVKIHLF